MRAGRWGIHLTTGIGIGLGIIAHVVVGIHAILVALHFVSREEDAHQRVIVARSIVVQLGQRVVVLPGIAFGGSHRPLAVSIVAKGAVDLVAPNRGTVGRVADGTDHAAQRVGEQEIGAIVVENSDLVSGQRVIGLAVERGAASIVDVILQAKDGDDVCGL